MRWRLELIEFLFAQSLNYCFTSFSVHCSDTVKYCYIIFVV